MLTGTAMLAEDSDARGDTGTLTGDGGAVARLVRHDELVLEAAAPHALGADEHQGFPAEGGHAGHLLVDQQLVAVELWARDGAVTRGGTPSREPWGPQGTPSREVPPRACHGHGLGTVPPSLGERHRGTLTGILRRQVHHPLLPLPAEAATQGSCRGHGGWLSWGRGQGQCRGTGTVPRELGPAAGAVPWGRHPGNWGPAAGAVPRGWEHQHGAMGTLPQGAGDPPCSPSGGDPLSSRP